MSFKSFDLSSDVASIVSFVNEVIAVSGSIFTIQQNVKYFDNVASGSTTKLGGYWQTSYDASPTSSLSTPLFDLTCGYSTGSAYNVGPTATSMQNEKIKMYRHFANTLLGNKDSLFTIGGVERTEAFFLIFKRNIHKDEIKKGNTSLVINTDLANTGIAQYTASDVGSVTSFKQGPGGEYAPLKISGSSGNEKGQVWYNAGVIILTPTTTYGIDSTTGLNHATWSGSAGTDSLRAMLFSSSIDDIVDGLRGNVERIDLHNQTNLHSTVYFARATNTEFNYSSNPTFIDENQRIRVTSGSNILQTRTYITTIGLYGPQDDLLAVAKVSKPITKSPDTEAIFRVRLDY